MDCTVATSKTFLFFLSMVFWAAGGALAYVGAYMINSYDNFESFIQDKYTLIPAAIILGISAVLFFFGMLGCCSTIRESKAGLTVFFMVIVVIFAAEVSALVFGFVYHNKLSSDLEHSMTDVFAKYGEGGGDNKAVEFLQTQLQCCGVQNYTSWASTPWGASHNNSVPVSCCKNTSTPECLGSLALPDLLNLGGCEPKLEALMQGVLGYAMLVLLGFAVIKLFGMLSVCVITCKTGSRRSSYQPLYA